MLLRPTDIDVSEMIFQQEVDVIDVRKTQESDLNPISDLPSPSHVIMAFAAEDEIVRPSYRWILRRPRILRASNEQSVL